MSSDTFNRAIRLREYLKSCGWVESDVILESKGLYLLTHPGHEQRQLQLPSDKRYSDWEELTDRMAEKVAEMTGVETHDIWAAAMPQPTPARRSFNFRHAALCIGVFACTFLAGQRVEAWRNSTPSISISLAGCIDSSASLVLASLAFDVERQDIGKSDALRKFMWTRWRAVQTASAAEEMRRCYLESQSFSEDFDPKGLISDDMHKIEEAVKVVYSHIGATLVPDAPATSPEHQKIVATAYEAAAQAGDRISTRLGNMIQREYF